MKKFLGILVLTIMMTFHAKADRAVVVATFGSCDYFIAMNQGDFMFWNGLVEKFHSRVTNFLLI
jgi:hypothetical protein